MANEKKEKVIKKFKGELRWANLPPRPPQKPHPDAFDENEPKNCHYSVTVECSKEQFKELQEAGISAMTKLRDDKETGKTFIQVKATKIKGDTTFADPKVIDKYREPVTESIGNGSTGVVLAEVAPIKGRKGKALRLKVVQVLDLIPYEDDSTAQYDELLEGEERVEQEVSDDDDATETML